MSKQLVRIGVNYPQSSKLICREIANLMFLQSMSTLVLIPNFVERMGRRRVILNMGGGDTVYIYTWGGAKKS